MIQRIVCKHICGSNFRKMSDCLENLGCPLWCKDSWKKLQITKWLLLCIGTVMAISGYYISSSLIVLDVRQEMWVVCSLFWGTAGVFIIAYSIALYVLSEYRQFPALVSPSPDRPATTDSMPIETMML